MHCLTFPSRLYPNKTNIFVWNELIETTNGVTTTTDTCDNDVWKFPPCFIKLLFDLLTYDFLEIADDGWKWVRSNGRANEVVCCCKVFHKITKCFIGRIFQCAAT